MLPIISIIVPVYKVEKFLSRCIDSILIQSFPDFELILVDDGSPDNSPQICDQYARKDSRISVIHKTNGGLSSARNAGIKRSRGSYLLFCDSDDYVYPNWCETLYEVILKHPASLIITDICRINSNGQKQFYLDYAPSDDSDDEKEISYFQAFQIGLSGYTVNKIYERKLILENNIFFDESCKYAEDVEFNVKYCLLVSHIILKKIPLYYYYYNDSGITAKYYNDLFSMRLPQFKVRLPLISIDEMPLFCDSWLFTFMHLFENVFDKRNTWSFFKKMQYNNTMLNTEEMRFCLANASGKKENTRILSLLRSGNYYKYWFFQKLVQLKHKLWR